MLTDNHCYYTRTLLQLVIYLFASRRGARCQVQGLRASLRNYEDVYSTFFYESDSELLYGSWNHSLLPLGEVNLFIIH